MIPALQYPFDPAQVLRKRKAWRRELLASGGPWIEKKIAVLGGSSTQDIVTTLDIFLLNEGIRASFYESDFGLYREDALFGNPELDAFAPDLIFFHTTIRNLKNFPAIGALPETIRKQRDEELEQWQEIWTAVGARYGCAIIQNNFEPPSYRLLGNLDAVDPHGGVAYVNALNDGFYDWARSHSGFFIHDIAYRAADVGLRQWHDEPAWHMYKYAFSVKAIPEYCYGLASLIRSLWGKSRKVLALDLDNTLWGGVIGDDGVSGIVLGPESAKGEAYLAFQRYLHRLSERGVLLCVNSKNDEENALAGLRHPAGVLRPEAFAMIVANWEPKDGNLATIAETLGLGLESFVFADDNPVERGLVEATFPDVAVPPLNTVDHSIQILDRSGYFEPAALTAEDTARGAMYAANARRDVARQTFADYGSYLASLEMKARIGPFDPACFQRITQLTNKTNQFNLTTRRYTEAEIQKVAVNPDAVCLTGALEDRYGDNGLVTVMIGTVQDTVCRVALWLMSCRVLKRGLEFAMMTAFIARCRERGVQTVIGRYVPTAKNAMVAGLYADCGFTRVGEEAGGCTVWALNVNEYQARTVHIQVMED